MARPNTFRTRSKQLTDKLRRLRQDTQGPVREALAAAADEIVAMQKRLVPDGAGTGERDLKGTIGWHFGAAEGGGSDAKTGRSGATSIVITAGDENNPEAAWVEFGTAPHENGGKFAGTQNPGTPPRPYFFPGYRANKKKAKARVAKAIRDVIREVST